MCVFSCLQTHVKVDVVAISPITSNSPSSDFWGIDQSIRYGRQTILSTTSGIVDTGTTLILIATDAYDAYASATGATADSTTGLLKITLSQYSNLESLFFEASGVRLSVPFSTSIFEAFLEYLWTCSECPNLASCTQQHSGWHCRCYLSRCRWPWKWIWSGSRLYQWICILGALLLRLRHCEQSSRICHHEIYQVEN